LSALQSTIRVTRWRQIAEKLRRDVSAGRFSKGRFPTEAELAARFAVNRHTIRQAIGMLVDQGLLKVTQGRGTFVADRHIDYLLGRRTRFAANLEREGREASYRLISVKNAKADAATAADLGLRRGSSLIQLETVGSADGVPLSYAVHRFPASRFSALPAAFVDTKSITAALAACGVADYTRRLTRLLARPPSEREASYLDQPVARPVLQVEAVNVDAKGVPIQRSTTIFAGDRVQMIVAEQ
jgi:GntR family phosphonate transport system transcriptional regulator